MPTAWRRTPALAITERRPMIVPPVRRLARSKLHARILLVRRHDQTRPQIGDGCLSRGDGITPVGFAQPQVVAVATAQEDVVFIGILKLEQRELVPAPVTCPGNDFLTQQTGGLDRGA